MTRPQFNLNKEQRLKIKWLRLDEKYTASEIRNKIFKPNGKKYQLKVIKKWVERVDKTGDVELLSKSGRPRKLSQEQENALINNIRTHCKTRGGYTTIRRSTALFHMTTRTVNNYGLRNGFRSYRAVKKPALKPSHIQERIKFCDYWLKRLEDTGKIVIVDEKLFNGSPTNNYMPVLRKKGERFNAEHIHHSRRPNENANCNILAYIGPFGKGQVFLAENKDYYNPDATLKENFPNFDKKGKPPGFDGASYEDLIENFLIPEVKKQVGDNKWLFMQDNAPIHCVKKAGEKKTNIQQIFEKEGVEMVKLPPLSPDLTPIENVFSLLAREYSKIFDELSFNQYPKTKQANFGYIKQAWDNIDNEKVKKIYFSFNDRLLKVKAANGLNNFKL